MTIQPLIVDRVAPQIVPARLLFRRTRSSRALYVWEREVWLRTRYGWIRWPRGYVTDFGSRPWWSGVLSLGTIDPLGDHVWAAGGHDWGYAGGEPGRRAMWDDIFDHRMKVDGTNPVKRAIMAASVRLGGAGGYAKAKTWWDTENFADPETGQYPVPPPFPREEAFAGGRWGLRDRPDWDT